MNLSFVLRMLLWIVPACLQVVILITMVRRRFARVFPLFFTYMAIIPTRTVILLVAKNHLALYSWIYWLGEAIAVLLGLAVIYEVLWHLIRPYPFLRTLGRGIFSLTAAAAVFLAVVMLARAPKFGRTPAMIESLILLERSARFLQAGLLVFLIFFISRFGLTWKHYAVGIAVGFGVAAGLQLAVAELRADLPFMTDRLYVWLKPASYSCAVGLWAAYFLPSEKRENIEGPLPRAELAKWDRMLEDYLRR